MSSQGNDITALSRRKLLGGMATIGAAGALGGAGTMAFFSDEEEFANNQLTAGELDLKVDWEEHYVDGSDDEFAGVTVQRTAPSDTAGWVGLPDPQDPMVWVQEEDLETYMDNTSIEAYPDNNDDGSQDLGAGISFDGQDELVEGQSIACDDFADLPEGLVPLTGDAQGPSRSLNQDTVANFEQVMDEGADPQPHPLVNLHDVKPGDFGELTLSYHLCDNPGYLWLTGELVSESENGLTEPEAKDPDEVEGVVELTDKIQTLAWYDEDGDNVYEPGGETNEADVVLILDHSGSMSGNRITDMKNAATNLVNALGAGVQVGVVGFDSSVGPTQPLTGDKSVVNGVINGLSAGGTTNIEGAVDEAQTVLDNGRSGVQKIAVLLTDGAPNVNGDGNDEGDAIWGNDDPTENAQTMKGAGTELYTIGLGIDTSTTNGQNQAALLEDMSSDPDSQYSYLSPTSSELQQVFAQIGQIISGEEAFFRGTLRELLDAVSSGTGIPLDGDRSTEFDELNGDPTAESRDEVVNSTTNAIGLAWWLPVDHANEIQGDSVSFNLGFYTEQSRHNDGSGIGSA